MSTATLNGSSHSVNRISDVGDFADTAESSFQNPTPEKDETMIATVEKNGAAEKVEKAKPKRKAKATTNVAADKKASAASGTENTIASKVGGLVRPRLTEEETKLLLDDLERIWAPFEAKGFEVRLEVGRQLNEALKCNPLERLPHGDAVLQKAAERLGISQSELSRMRWFAFLFQSVGALHETRPDLTSWTKFKEALPDMAKAAKEKAGIATNDVQRSPGTAAIVGGLSRSLDHLIKQLDRKELQVEGKQKDKLLDQLQELAKAVALRLQINITVKRD